MKYASVHLVFWGFGGRVIPTGVAVERLNLFKELVKKSLCVAAFFFAFCCSYKSKNFFTNLGRRNFALGLDIYVGGWYNIIKDRVKA